MQICTDVLQNVPCATAVAVGFFDGVHLGHRAVIERALSHRAEGLCPVVFSFAASGALPPKKSGAGWLTTERQKAERIEALGAEMLLLPPFAAFRDEAPEEFARYLAENLHAKVVCCGYDYRFGKGAAASCGDLRRLLLPYGVALETVDAVSLDGAPVSSTRIRALLYDGFPEEAARLLGAPFTLDAAVVHGRALGHTLGFPTINQRFPDGFLVPKYGVYAARAVVGGRAYPAVTNVGVKPTVGDALPGAESNLLDFSGDLYGKEVRLEFLRYLRAEKKFPSLDALKSQIASDCARAKQLFSETSGVCVDCQCQPNKISKISRRNNK